MLDNGLVVAVKKLSHSSPEGGATSKSVKRRLQKELELLAGLRHRNIMSLRAYVRESDEFSLVYDYMPNGSLEDVMSKVRGNEMELGWEVRLRIAVGIVKGLQYLHFGCEEQQILHYNLKPTNVVLDSEFEPRLTDCGLAKIMASSQTSIVSCYSAPESSQSNRCLMLIIKHHHFLVLLRPRHFIRTEPKPIQKTGSGRLRVMPIYLIESCCGRLTGFRPDPMRYPKYLKL